MRQAWPIVEPSRSFVDAWHLRAIAEHLEAVTRGDIHNLVINMPPGHAKPVYNRSMILLASGARKELADVCVGDHVVTHTGKARQVSAVHEQGVLPALTIKTDTGRSVVAALDHPFLTPDGWVQAQDLTVGDTLALVVPDDRPRTDRLDEDFRLAGYFIGDGSCRSYPARYKTPQLLASITCHDPIEGEDIIHCAQSLGFVATASVSKSLRQYNIKGGVRPWLIATGLAGQGSHTKRVPAFIFEGSKEQIAHFVGAYFSCDGTLNRKGGARTDLAMTFTSVNRPLLEDVQHLLLRLGIRARIRARTTAYNTFAKGPHHYHNLELTSQDDTARFAQRVPIYGVKAERLARWGARRAAFDSVLIPDKITAIDNAGEVDCRCLTVDEDHSFLIDDIAVHNSLTVAVFWPVWEWLTCPSRRWLFASYALSLSMRDSLKCRRIITSPWFQERWSNTFRLRDDQNAKMKFENDRTGYRLATSVGGTVTGERGDRVVVDDPHNLLEAASDTKRAEVITWWDEAMSTRLNDFKTGARVIVMQRLHTDDLSGHVLARGGYEHLCLPTEYDPNRVTTTSIGFRDPRTVDGELLAPALFGPEQNAQAKRDLGPYGYAGQHGQTPAPREGGMFQAQWFRAESAPPASFAAVARYWDKAGALPGKGDWTVGVLMGRTHDGYYWLLDVVRGQWPADERNRVILETAKADRLRYPRVKQWVEQPPGLAKEATDTVVRLLAGHAVEADPVRGDKPERAEPFSGQLRAGNVRMLTAPWNDPYLAVMCAFPMGSHDDDVDASAGAFNKLCVIESVSGWSPGVSTGGGWNASASVRRS